jgi:hypothetical protein
MLVNTGEKVEVWRVMKNAEKRPIGMNSASTPLQHGCEVHTRKIRSAM